MHIINVIGKVSSAMTDPPHQRKSRNIGEGTVPRVTGDRFG